MNRHRFLQFFTALGTLLLLFACAGQAPPPIVEIAPQPVPEAPVQGPAVPVAQLDLHSPLLLDPDVKVGKLENGLTFYLRANQKPEQRAELWLAVNAGSLQEDEDQRGLAHFLEHMAFNGTEHFEKQELVSYLEQIGMSFGPDINAFTSFDETVFTLRVPTDDEEILDTAFQILSDWADGITLAEEEIEKERGVVIEEWRLGRGAEARIRDQQIPLVFQGSRYAERLPIGDMATLEKASRETLERFYRDWYRPDLMAVIAVGDFDPKSIERRIRAQFGTLKGPELQRAKMAYPVPDHEDTLFGIVTDPEATNTGVAIYHKLEKRSDNKVADYRRILAEGLYHRMLNARLDELRQAPDPPFLYAISTSGGFVRTRDVYFQSAGVAEGGVERGLSALLREVERVDRHGFTATELERAKKDFLRGMERAFEERDKRRSGGFASEYLRYFLQGLPAPGIDVELQLTRRFLPEIEVEELNRLADDWIQDRNRVILLSGPEKAEAPLPDETALAAIFEEARQARLEPHVDRVRESPLVPEPPKPGLVVKEEKIEALGVTEWHLANGVRVILKPTDFKNDQVLLTGFSPGGHSLVDDESYLSATFADAAVQESGLGDFDQIELDKALAGKVASVRPFIGELEEGLAGGASPQDLETLFQLVYLAFTGPHHDAPAFAAYLDRLRARLENRLADPGAVFGDELARLIYRNHPRRRPPQPEMLEQVDYELALKIYRERFADASDFTFVLVGNLMLEKLRPLVETYLGGLPAANREESWRDVGAETPPGVEKLVVHKGLEPKARVELLFSGPAEWSREEAHKLRSLAEVMRIRMREILREDLGATYGVQVSGGLHVRPRETFSVSISFGCSPDAVDDLIGTVFREVADLKENDVDVTYIEKVKEIQIRRRETDLKENFFWLRGLKRSYDLGLDPLLLLRFDELVQTVDPASIRAAANRYLDEDRYVLGVLRPESEAPSP